METTNYRCLTCKGIGEVRSYEGDWIPCVGCQTLDFPKKDVALRARINREIDETPDYSGATSGNR